MTTPTPSPSSPSEAAIELARDIHENRRRSLYAERCDLHGRAHDVGSRACTAMLIDAFAREREAAAYERAAKVCDEVAWSHSHKGMENGPELNSAKCAASIRALPALGAGNENGGRASCLACGRVGERGSWSSEHPEVYVCVRCRDLGQEAARRV